jgi:hemoglobin/transferrin/lactoferrin receptor protein
MRTKLMTGVTWSAISLAALATAGTASAQQGPLVVADNDAKDIITITATRVEQRADEVPAVVSVLDAQKIEDEMATDIKDLVRFEPGVSVRSSPGRFTAAGASTGRDGNSGFNIRGLEGNRVLMQVDGVRLPDAYSFGPEAQGRGDYVDLDLLKSVEILRGPASALYGSDGVAGAVNFITRDPADLIGDGHNFGIRARSSYSSADVSFANSLMATGKLGDWSAMVAYTRRDGHAQDNQGDVRTADANRTAPNPMDYGSIAWLG